MKTKVILTAALIALGLWGADQIQPLDAKLGLWEITTSQTMTGAPPISPDVLAKLPPDQRAKIEARFKQNSGTPNVATRQSCMTQDKLAKAPFSEERQGCTRQVITSTSHELVIHQECTEANGVRTLSDAKFEVSGNTAMKGSIKIKAMRGDHTTNMDVDVTGKWTSADCGTVK